MKEKKVVILTDLNKMVKVLFLSRLVFGKE